MHEAEEAVLFVLQVLPKHVHKVVHPLAVADFQVELRVGIEHIVEGVVSGLWVCFVIFEFRPRPRQVLPEDPRVLEGLPLAEIVLIELVSTSEISSLSKGLAPFVVVELLEHLVFQVVDVADNLPQLSTQIHGYYFCITCIDEIRCEELIINWV